MLKGQFSKQAVGTYIVPNHTWDNGLKLAGTHQKFQFMETLREADNKDIITGTTEGILIESLLEMAVDRLKDLNDKLPNRYTSVAITDVEHALATLARRDAIRAAEGKTGTRQA